MGINIQPVKSIVKFCKSTFMERCQVWKKYPDDVISVDTVAETLLEL